MSAETLRQAAKVLRERAKAAYTKKARTPYSDPEIPPVSKPEWGHLIDGYLGGEVGVYCATMHPGVGLGLAVVLDAVARDVDLLNEAAPRPCSDETLDFNLTAYGESVALARLILGGDS